jgi:hypothetical protein
MYSVVSIFQNMTYTCTAVCYRDEYTDCAANANNTTMIATSHEMTVCHAADEMRLCHIKRKKVDLQAPDKLEGMVTIRALLSALPEIRSEDDGLNCKHAVGKPSWAFRIVSSGCNGCAQLYPLLAGSSWRTASDFESRTPTHRSAAP